MGRSTRRSVAWTIRALVVYQCLAPSGCIVHRETAEEPAADRRDTVSSVRLRQQPPFGAVRVMRQPTAPPPASGGLPGADLRVNQDLSLRFQDETAVAVDPANPQHMVAAWCDNFLFDTNWTLQLTDLAFGSSFDGGQTWQSQIISFGNIPSGALTADPALAFDASGNVFLSMLQYDPFDRFNPDKNKVFVAKSTDGGVTYTDPAFIDAGGVDKPWIATDGTTVYVVWSNLGTIYFSKSQDGGQSYSARQDISGSAFDYNGPVPVVGPAGELFVVFARIGQTVFLRRSYDAGATWSSNLLVSNVVEPDNLLLGGFRNPALPTLTIDRSGGAFHGRLYAIWPDGQFGDPDILVSHSDDDGASWSHAVRVNDDTVGNGADQFFPWAAVDGNGQLHVSFLDRREDPEGLKITYYLATSTDGGDTFGPNILVSDGGSPPVEVFFGDYTAIVAHGTSLYSLWPDSRVFNQDVYFHPIDAIDFDGDGRLNDGDLDGQYGGDGCTGGQTTDCDDNCPGTPNPDQFDGDGDRIGDVCDNCIASTNADQFDLDRDGVGDACDSCPSQAGATAGDPDGDAADGCVDNCPDHANPFQQDGDEDGLGDACDPCVSSAANDDDGDGLCGDVDNCPFDYNPLQVDTDSDGVGEICDNCSAVHNTNQADADFDDEGDACDCDSSDFTQRRPRTLRRIDLAKPESGARIIWTHTTAADSFSVSRGLLSMLGPRSYGSCLGEGVGLGGLDDDQVPPAGEAYFYLVQGDNVDCGLGFLGFGSSEIPRVNGDGGACVGAP